MNKFFTHPMRPFFVGAAVLAILGVLVFLISPGAIVLHRQIFLELMLPAQTAGFTALAVGFILLAKLRELHHHELLRKHYVRTYYLLQLFAAAGYLWAGAAKLQNLPASAPLHLITLGGMMGGVMMVWLTAGLWHSGFTKLDYPKLCRIAVPILFAAAVSRAVLMNVNPIFFIIVPAILTAAVFVLYLLTFVPIFRANAFTDDPE